MNRQIQIDLSEEAARKSPICLGCFIVKEVGNIVCWNCFKYIPNGYKYFNGTFDEWLLQYSGGKS